MGSSAGRRSAAYIRARERFKQGDLLCHLCGKNPGLTVDHQPPLHTAPHPDLWQGTYLPACARCQSRQGALIRNRYGTPSRDW